MNNYYVLNGSETATAYAKADNETVKKLWNSFFLKKGSICFRKSEDFIFRIGNTMAPILREGKEFALKVRRRRSMCHRQGLWQLDAGILLVTA